MIHKKKIAEAIKKTGKRASKEAVLAIEKILKKQVEEIIEKAKRKADFAGRKTILKEDLESQG